MRVSLIENLYKTYRQDLYSYLLSLTRNKPQAEDLLSETFIRAIQGLAGFRGDSSVKTWLFGIARNLWLQQLRGQHQTLSYDDLLEVYMAETLGDSLLNKLLLHRIQELLDEWGGSAAQVVRLRAAGYSDSEISSRLKLSESSARVMEYRIRQRLRTTLEKEGLF